MPFSRLKFEKVWTSSADFPTYEGSETQVRADMQYHPDAIRDYLNNLFLKELEGPNGSSMIGAGTGLTLEQALELIRIQLTAQGEDIKNISIGEPAESIRSILVEFAAEEWSGTPVEGEETVVAPYTLVIPYEKHKRLSEAYGYRLQMLADGQYKTNVWAAMETQVVFDAETKEIRMTGEEPYAGRVVFFGV